MSFGNNLNREDVALVFAYVSVATKLPQFGRQQLEVHLPMYLGTVNPLKISWKFRNSDKTLSGMGVVACASVATPSPPSTA